MPAPMATSCRSGCEACAAQASIFLLLDCVTCCNLTGIAACLLTLATVPTPANRKYSPRCRGEGPSAGRPSVFIRLSRCNLACVWCDTAYTWRFIGDNRPHRRRSPTFDRAENQLRTRRGRRRRADRRDGRARAPRHHRRRTVIAGPCPRPPAARLLPDMHVEIETNGTVAAAARAR